MANALGIGPAAVDASKPGRDQLAVVCRVGESDMLMGRVRKNKLKALLLAVVMLASPVGVALALNSEDLLQRYAQAEAAGDFAEAAAAAELLANGNHDGIKLPPEEQLILKRAAADNH
ncbi:MAG: hypothetical protein AAGF19_07430, partial [Pseudomonadota bacterium]